MKTWLIIAAAAVQVLVLVYMAGEREWVLRTGTRVYLRTMPIDPQDHFRGDYVRLDYEVSHVPTNRLRGEFGDLKSGARDRQVYASLVEGPGQVARLGVVTDRRPDEGVFIRGRTERYYGGDMLPVRYGIEAFFVQQKQGLVLEAGRQRGEVQVPLEMEVAVGKQGIAVLRGYRWCPLGIGLKLVTTKDRLVRSATVELMNVSSNDLAIVDFPGGRSLALELDHLRNWGEKDWSWVGSKMAAPPLAEAKVVVLKPNARHEIQVNLESPEWFVSQAGGPPKTLAAVGWQAMFRLVYRPPSEEECRRLEHADLIWHGELLSRAFGGGRVD